MRGCGPWELVFQLIVSVNTAHLPFYEAILPLAIWHRLCSDNVAVVGVNDHTTRMVLTSKYQDLFD